MFSAKMSSAESKEKTVTPQTKFVEEQVREGHSLEDIKMWQNLCKSLALLDANAEETMHGVLSICDKDGISPMTLMGEMRSMGFKTACEGIDSALEAHFDRVSGTDGHTTDGGDDFGDEDDDEDRMETARKRIRRRFQDEMAHEGGEIVDVDADDDDE